MSGKLNFERVNRQERLTYTPSWRVLPPTQKQLDFILRLAYRKGQPRPKFPKTKHGAGEMIERLQLLPDAEPLFELGSALASRPAPSNEARAELVSELREAFPVLTPMTVNSLVQLINQVDELGCYLFFDELSPAGAPEDLEELIPWILSAFLDWLG